MTSAVVVAGALANKPGSSGEAWVRMSWVRGLAALGLDVWFVEQLDDSVDPDPAALKWFRYVVDAFGLGERASLLHRGEALAGPDLDELGELASEAALVNISGNLTLAALVNISGHLTLATLKDAFRLRAMIDIDPGFTQFWHAAGLEGANVEGHDAYFTIGELIGTPGCPIPTAGLNWQPVRQPVLLEDWPVSPSPERDRFTTIATWRTPFGSIEFEGRTYGLKVHEFRRFIALPKAAPHRFELALEIHPGDAADLGRLREHGWQVVDPRAAVGDLESFRAYIRGSGAEYSVAQGVYVDTGSGWFSDRTTRYLASGRPALIQDTGFSRLLPVGDGLVAFTSLDEAVAGAADIVARYEEHAAAARRLAAEHFAAPLVMADFCERAGIDRPRR